MDMAPEANPEQGAPGKAIEKSIRLIRPSVVVLCGPAACGKSSFAERHFRATQIISSDWARGRVCDDERDQRFQAQAFALVHFLIEQRLTLNRLCVVDSTALTLQARHDLLNLARKYQVPCVALLFDVSLEKCIERDEARERTVGRAVIERQYEAFKQAQASLRTEGFDQVVELGDEDLERARIEVVFRPVARPATRPARPAPGTPRRGPRPEPVSPPARPAMQNPARPGAQERTAGSAPSPTGARAPVPSSPPPAAAAIPKSAAPAPTVEPAPAPGAPGGQAASAPANQTAGSSAPSPGTRSGGPQEQGKT